MVEFISLFVGLILGVQDVSVAVSGPVARVEIRIDDEVVGEVTKEPWAISCDFGLELHPRRLDAVAFDDRGRELARARRWINLPGLRADAEIVAIRDEHGDIMAAKLTWASPEFERPRKIVVELDGERVKTRPPWVVDLTDLPERRVHVLGADFDFGSGVVVRRELVFGPDFEGVQDTGLTAVAVNLDEIDELPEIREMEGWFVSNGDGLTVAAVEKPEARVVLVRDPTALDSLEQMLPELERRRKKARRSSRSRTRLDVFDDDVDLFVLSPQSMQPDGRAARAVLFPFSNRPTPGSEGVAATAVKTSSAAFLGGPVMLSDAVAVAALRAAEGNGRRAVILLLGPEREDGSRFGPDVARGFLRDLRVPLVVWDFSGPAQSPPPGWGDAAPVDNVDDLVRRVRRIRYRLDEQRIVWIRGRHLPQQIELSEKAEGISLAE